MNPTIVVAEIGINHQADMPTAGRLIEKAAWAGADYVKFQKRSPRDCVPEDQWVRPYETPWGTMPYIEYKERMEFDFEQLRLLSSHARQCGIGMFLSVWDLPSLEVAAQFAFPYIKLPSAKLTDEELVKAATELACKQRVGLILSTGMSTAEEIGEALGWVYGAWTEPEDDIGDLADLWVLHCHSAYPAPTRELNLLCIPALKWDAAQCLEGPESEHNVPHSIGYSGHEFGIQPSVWAVVLGAEMIERHITLDKTMWGNDHWSSLEPHVFNNMVRYIRSFEEAVGNGEKCVWPSEMPALEKLRGLTDG